MDHLSGFIYELLFCLQGHPDVQELEGGHSSDVIGYYVILSADREQEGLSDKRRNSEREGDKEVEREGRKNRVT